MRHVPIAELKDHISELVAAASRGEEFIITRHGKVAARLLPPSNVDEERSRRAREAMTRMAGERERMRAAGLTATADDWIEWKNAGRR